MISVICVSVRLLCVFSECVAQFIISVFRASAVEKTNASVV